MRNIFKSFFILFASIIFAQSDVSKITPLSPNSSAFEKYGTVPVNLSSGVITPSIPLFTIPIGNDSFDIKINYSSQGLRVDELPTNIGMGWSLNLGSITRIVRDLPDEDNNGRISHINEPISGSNNFHIGNMLSNVEMIDAERDVFSVNVDGYHTKFLIDDDLSIVKLTIDNIIIDIINPIKDPTSTQNKVRIITPNGNQYFFGGNYGIETATSRLNQQGGAPATIRHATSWLLSEVIYPSKNGFKIYYQRKQLWYLDGMVQTAQITFPFPSNTESGLPRVLPGETTNVNTRTYTTSPLLIEGVNFKVDFELSEFDNVINSQAVFQKIASITLKNNNSIVQKIKFDYDMFSSNNVGMNSFSIPISRPFLKSVTFQDQSPEGSSSYLLDYFNPEMIPQRFSYAQDLLGYYNGKNNSNFIFNSLLDYDNLPEYELVSPNKVDFSNLIYRVTADRKPNIDVAKNGTLKKITYPTKGYTNFNYEGNLTNNREIIYPPYTMGTIDLPHKPNTVSGSHYKEIFITSPFDQKLYIGLAMNNTDIPQCDTHESSSLGISENGIPLDFYHLGNLGQTGNIGTASNFEMGYFDYFNEESQERLYVQLEGGKTYKIKLFAPRCVDSKVTFFYYNTLPTEGNFVEAGGLRIASVSNFDHNNNILSSKKYEYEGGDFTITKPISTFDKTDVVVALIAPITDHVTEILLSRSYTMSSNPRWSIKNNSGEFYTYSKVVEKEIDSLGLSKGYVNHYFERNKSELPANIQNIPTASSRVSIFKYKTNERVTEFYDSNNIIQRRIENDYKTDQLRFGSIYKSYNAKRTVSLKCAYEESFYYTFACPPTSNIGLLDSDPKNWSIMKSYDKSEWEYLSFTSTKDYLNGQELKTTTEYFYNNPLHYQITSQKTTFPDSSIQETKYQYAYEKGIQKLITANMVGSPLETEKIKDGKKLGRTETKYENPLTLFPTSVLSYNIADLNDPLNSNPTATSEVTYDFYDDKGNLLQYTTKFSIPTIIVWGYNQTQPIAKIEGATYPGQIEAKTTDILQSLIDAIINASNEDANDVLIGNPKENDLLAALDTFRKEPSLANYQITTYSYDPLIGVRSITPPSGIREYYTYDLANRLHSVKEINGKILKEYLYNYKP